MIDFNKALKKAKGLKTGVDHCSEYTDAFVFSSKQDEMTIGGDGPVVIVKDSGKALNMTSYVDNYTGTFMSEYDV